MMIRRDLGRFALTAEAKWIGKSLSVMIYGGDVPHVGAVSVAYPSKSQFRDASTVTVSTLSLPGHKDFVVSGPLAERLAKALDTPVVVTVGVHIDNASSQDLETVVAEIESMADELASVLK